MIRASTVTTRGQYKDITGIIHEAYFFISHIYSRTVVVSFIFKIIFCKVRLQIRSVLNLSNLI